MNEEQLGQFWITLTPTAEQRRRVDGRVFTLLEAHDTSLVAEWLGLFKVAPFTAAGLVTASAVSIVVATPLLWVVRGLM